MFFECHFRVAGNVAAAANSAGLENALAELVKLRVKGPPVGAHAGIAKATALRVAFGHILGEV